MKRYLAAAAIAPLCFAALEARAQTTITDARTAPVATSTTGDLTIGAGASIVIGDGAAVTLDSPAKVENDGTITINDAPGVATGILVTAGSGQAQNVSLINVGDTIVPTDTDGDGDLDGPFVTSPSARFGIHVVNPFTGSILNTGSINLKGNNSAGIAIDSALVGDLTASGVINAIGANTYGVHVSGPVTGSIQLGTIAAQGENSVGAAIDSPVSGIVQVIGALSSTGFRYPSRPNDLAIAHLDADDLVAGGPALRVRASVGRGVLINSVPADLDVANLDEDNDGIPDASEGTGSVLSIGSAPAVLIGGVSPIVLGNVGTAGSAFGLLVQGTAQAVGSYDGFAATVLQVGGQGGTVDTSGGIGLDGAVASSAFVADSVALNVGAGATAPVIANSGSVAATTTSSTTVAPKATGILIAAGATAPVLNNTGSILAAISGSAGQATAIQDLSGTLSTVTNTGSIGAATSATDASFVATSTPVALDLRNNTSGVSLTQSQSTVADAGAPNIGGGVLLGSGGDNVRLLAGSLTGALDFGAGANTLTLDGGATLTGAVTSTGTLATAVTKGTLLDDSATTLNMTSLSVGSESVVGFKLDPAAANPAARNTQFNVAGLADFATGARINLGFGSKLSNTTTFTLVQANTLSVAGLDTSLLSTLPFIYKAELATTANQINVTIARRTAAEIGLGGGPAAAFESVFTSFDRDNFFAQRLFSKSDQAGFLELYNQLLPDYSGGAFYSTSAGARAVMRIQAEAPTEMPENQRRSWLQEVGFSTSNKGNGADVPFDSTGFGIAGGIERADLGRGTIGFSAAFLSSDIDDANRRADSKLTASTLLGSVYWRDRPMDRLVVSASLTGGYSWFNSDRNVIDLDASEARVLQRQAGGKWQGAVGAARIGAYYEGRVGRFYVRPDAVLDYVYLYEQGYSEKGGGAAVDLAVNHRTSYEGAVEAGLTFGAQYGRVFHWGPEIRVAYRGVLASALTDTQARFVSGGSIFNLRALGVDKNRVIVRLALRGGSRYANVGIEATGDIGDVYTAYEGRLMVRFLF